MASYPVLKPRRSTDPDGLEALSKLATEFLPQLGRVQPMWLFFFGCKYV